MASKIFTRAHFVVVSFDRKMKDQLISSSSSSFSEDEDDVQQFTINEHYAKAFQYRKEREELAKRTHPLTIATRVVAPPLTIFCSITCSQGEVRLGC